MDLRKFFWDVDGVLKRLDRHVLGFDAEQWHSTKDGKNVIQIIDEDPSIIMYAEPTEYLDVVNEMYHGKTLHLITSQKPLWRPYNEKWLYKYLKCGFTITYTHNPAEKLSLLRPGQYIIDDNPNFPAWDRVILVDKKYNRHVLVPIRVHNPDALRACMERLSL